MDFDKDVYTFRHAGGAAEVTLVMEGAESAGNVSDGFKLDEESDDDGVDWTAGDESANASGDIGKYYSEADEEMVLL